MGRIIGAAHKSTTPSFYRPAIGPHGKVKTYKPIFDSIVMSEDAIAHVVEILRAAIRAETTPLVTILLLDEDHLKFEKSRVHDAPPLPEEEMPATPTTEVPELPDNLPCGGSTKNNEPVSGL